jgi:hypothetical protein
LFLVAQVFQLAPVLNTALGGGRVNHQGLYTDASSDTRDNFRQTVVDGVHQAEASNLCLAFKKHAF